MTDPVKSEAGRIAGSLAVKGGRRSGVRRSDRIADTSTLLRLTVDVDFVLGSRLTGSRLLMMSRPESW